MHYLSVALAAVGIQQALGQIAGPISVDNRTLDQIYSAAKTENSTLQVFWGGDAGSQGDGIRAAWKQRFPAIPLNLTVDLSKYHDNRIDRAHGRGLHVADVAVLQTLHDFARWKSEAKLLPYKPNTFPDLIEGEKDFDGASLPIAIYSFGSFIFDTSKLSANDIPPTYEELVTEKWKGKLILTYPNDDDAVTYLLSLVVSRYGLDWLYALASNDVRWVRGTGTPVLEMTAARNDTGTNSSHALTFTAGSGDTGFQTVEPEYPEQYMSWAQTGAIIASTPRPESAKLFMAFLTSPEWQEASTGGGLSVLNSLNEANGLDLYGSNVTQLSGFRVFEQNRANVEWWKNLFEEVLGTPQGLSPLQVYPNV